jgi:hypothetical protein
LALFDKQKHAIWKALAISVMSLSRELLEEIQRLLRKPSEWFSVPDIRERSPRLFDTEYVNRSTGEHLSFPHTRDRVFLDLEHLASGLLESELRTYESEIARVLAANARELSRPDSPPFFATRLSRTPVSPAD